MQIGHLTSVKIGQPADAIARSMRYYVGIRHPRWVPLHCPEALVEADMFTASFLNPPPDGCLQRYMDDASFIALPIIHRQQSSPRCTPKKEGTNDVTGNNSDKGTPQRSLDARKTNGPSSLGIH